MSVKPANGRRRRQVSFLMALPFIAPLLQTLPVCELYTGLGYGRFLHASCIPATQAWGVFFSWMRALHQLHRFGLWSFLQLKGSKSPVSSITLRSLIRYWNGMKPKNNGSVC